MFTLDKILLLLVKGLTETFLVHFQLSMLMKRKKHRNRFYPAILLLYFCATVFDAANNFKIYFVFMIAYVLIAVTALISYEGSNASKLSISFVCIAMNYSATILATTIDWRYLRVYQNFPENLNINFFTQVVLTVVCVLMVFAFKFYARHISTKFVPMLITAFCLPLAIFILLLRQYYLIFAEKSALVQMEGYFIVAFLLLFSSMLLYTLTQVNDRLSNSLSYSATLEQMLAMQEKYYGDLQKHQEELRRINHDIKNHTRAIIGLIEAKRYGEVKDYAVTLQDTITNITAPVTNCDNQLINALLNDKLGDAKQNGVELSLCVMVPSSLRIDSVDVCILLGNLLDNAVEACAKMRPGEKKFIDVDIRIRGFFLCFDISNSYSDTLEFSDKGYLTTKKDKLYHGVGISNVRRVVDKYDGRLNFSHDKNVFNVSALLTYSSDE